MMKASIKSAPPDGSLSAAAGELIRYAHEKNHKNG